MTHPVEYCGADGFDNEVVIQTQFLQVLIEVIWIQINNKQFQEMVTHAVTFITGNKHTASSFIVENNFRAQI